MKKRAMMQKAKFEWEDRDGQDGEKERVTLRSSLRSLFRGRFVRRAMLLSKGKKKVRMKQIRSKEMD
jgi:hypothetical protein